MQKKKIFVLTIAASLVLGSTVTVPVSADPISDLQQEVQQNTAELNSVRETIGVLEEEKQEVAGEIDTLDGQIVSTIANIELLNTEIADMEEQLVQTGKDLAAAIEVKDNQYDAMKKRIQYLYETGGEAGWATVFLETGNITDILNQSEYTSKMYEYDRNCLQEYADAVASVEALQEQQAEEKSSLETSRLEQQEQQKQYEQLLEEAKASYDDYEVRLADAEQLAQQYVELIDQQNAEIRRMEAEREAARRAAEAAARAAAQRAASQRAAARAAAGAAATAQAAAASQAAANGGSGNSSSSSDGSSYSGGSGSSAVDYAMQYVGNPYVWGGNSLTNGIDCSHFVTQVLTNTGNYSGGYKVADDWKNVGKTISYADAQPGDVIVYSGHVALYAGDGKIVHASSSKTGIIVSDAVRSKPIVSVQRVSG